jgi:hypothetical protein
MVNITCLVLLLLASTLLRSVRNVQMLPYVPSAHSPHAHKDSAESKGT